VCIGTRHYSQLSFAVSATRSAGSNPSQYIVRVRAGLPSGCAEKNRHEVQRVAEAITVTVLNWMPTGSPPCTMIYGSYELNVNLGANFRHGTTYFVSVNDKRTSFVAQ
jgi:hypothetical protein